VPYFVALISHALIADFLIGGQLQLLWPFTQAEFGLHELGFFDIYITSYVNIAMELSLFAASSYILFKSKDYKQFLQDKKSNLVIAIPILTVLLPSVVSYPLAVPLLLVLPHLFYLVLFAVAVLVVFLSFFGKRIFIENKKETK
jgi:hypothetical protein